MQNRQLVEKEDDIELGELLALALQLTGARSGRVTPWDGTARSSRLEHGERLADQSRKRQSDIYLHDTAPPAGSQPGAPRNPYRARVPSSTQGERLALELVWQEADPGPAPRREALADRVAEMIGALLRFRERLRSLNSPFAENPGLRRRIQMQLARFQEQSRAGQGLSAHLTGATELVAEVLAAEVVQIFLAERSRSVPRLSAVRGLPRDLVGRTRALPGSRSLAGWTLEQRAAVVSDDLAQEKRFHVSALVLQRGARSALAVPIQLEDGPCGAFVVYWTVRRSTRSGEIHFVRSLADLITLALKYRSACLALGRELSDLDRLKREIRAVWTPVYLSVEDRGKVRVPEAVKDDDRRFLQEFADSIGGGTAVPEGGGWRRCIQAVRRDELLSILMNVHRLAGSDRRFRTTVIPRSWLGESQDRAALLVTDVTREGWIAEQLRAAADRWRYAAGDAAVEAAVIRKDGWLVAGNGEWRRRRERGGCGAGTTFFVRSAAEAPFCSSPACVPFARLLEEGLEEVIRGRRMISDSEYRCSSLGSDRWFSVRIEPVGPDPEGTEHAVVVEWEVTARRLAEDELRRKEAGANAIYRSAAEAIFTVNHRGIIEGANPAASRIFGADQAELVGFRLHQLFPAPGERGHDASLRKALEGNLSILVGKERAARGRHISGSGFPMSFLLMETAVGAHVLYTVVIRDLTEQKRAEEAIEKLTFHDPITGLANRHLFRDRLDLALMQARRTHGMLGVLFLDIDRFKRVNESWGHSAGDHLLVAVARRLEQVVRSSDVVARWSGDEYNVLLPRIRGPEEVLATANRIRHVLGEPFDVQGHTVYVTASVGFSVYPRDGADGDALIRHADMAMYRAKRLGTQVDQVCPGGLRRAAAARQQMDVELHRAVEHGEFVVHLQPEVDLKSGRVAGAECLVRWNHPRLGLLRPNAFIGLAERTGLIVPIGHRVLTLACHQIAVWQASGLPALRVAVNLSLRQVQDPGLIDSIEQLLRSSGIHPDWLDLEITESIALSAAARRLKTLDRLKALGVRMSLDDFGQGYSSLNRLRRLPVETLKIDRAFVRRIRRDPRDAAIVRAIIQMGHSFGLRVVAEGVSCPEEARFLVSEECDTAQGYLYGAPAPIADFERLVGTDLSDRHAA